MYSLDNVPTGYFEALNRDGLWVKTHPQQVMTTMRIEFGDKADAYFDELIRAGIEKRASGLYTSPLYRFISVKG